MNTKKHEKDPKPIRYSLVLFEDSDIEISLARIIAKKLGFNFDVGPFSSLEEAGHFFGRQLAPNLDILPTESGYHHLVHHVPAFTDNHSEVIIATDLNMPVLKRDVGLRGKTEPVGISVALMARQCGLPVVICTSDSTANMIGGRWHHYLPKIAGIEVVYDKKWTLALEYLRNKVVSE